MSYIDLRWNTRRADPEHCHLCRNEAETVIEFDTGQSVAQTALCWDHTRELIDIVDHFKEEMKT